MGFPMQSTIPTNYYLTSSFFEDLTVKLHNETRVKERHSKKVKPFLTVNPASPSHHVINRFQYRRVHMVKNKICSDDYKCQQHELFFPLILQGLISLGCNDAWEVSELFR